MFALAAGSMSFLAVVIGIAPSANTDVRTEPAHAVPGVPLEVPPVINANSEFFCDDRATRLYIVDSDVVVGGTSNDYTIFYPYQTDLANAVWINICSLEINCRKGFINHEFVFV